MASRTLALPALLVSLVTGALACSASASFGGRDAAAAATELIENDLAEQLDVTLTNPTCDAIDDPKAGDTFRCTAMLGDQSVAFDAEMVQDDRVNVQVADLVFNDAALREIEDAAAGLLTEQVGVELPPDNIDCGEGPAVVGDPFELLCVLTDPTSGDDYEATVSFDRDANLVGVDVADEPS